jgi:hypothetical protein
MLNSLSCPFRSISNAYLKLSEKNRINSSKFKCANIKFSIETGRWEDIDRNDRIYTFW